MKSAQLLAAAGVTGKVATTAAQAEFLVSAVFDDVGAGPIAIDIETAPKPEYSEAQAVVRLTHTEAATMAVKSGSLFSSTGVGTVTMKI